MQIPAKMLEEQEQIQVNQNMSLTEVVHHVDAACRENGHLSRAQGLLDGFVAVLLEHVRCGRAVDCDDVIGRSWVQMGRKHRARSQIQHRHCGVVSDMP